MSSNLKVGQLCLTVNTQHPEHNDGLLVVVLAVSPTFRAGGGELTPYLIRGIDGMTFKSTTEQTAGKQMQAWAPAYKLKPIDGEGLDARDTVRAPLEVTA